MSRWIVAFLLICLICGFLYVYSLKKELRRLTHLFEQFPEDSRHGSRLSIDFREKKLLAFLSAANQMIDRYEQQLMQMNHSEQVLDESIVSITHDLRTPLTSIKGYLQLAQRTENEQKKNDYLSIAEKSVDRLVELTDQFYEIAKSTPKSRASESLEPLPLVEEVFFNFFEPLEQVGIQVSFPETTSHAFVLLEREKFLRILENLVQNILRYGKDQVIVSEKTDCSHYYLLIENGMHQTKHVKIERVFDRFYSENTARSNTGSLGIGLYTVKQLIESMGGSVTAAINDTCFSIQLAFPLASLEKTSYAE